MRNQLGRRNLSPVDFKPALGRRYIRTKKSQGGDYTSQEAKDQNDLKLNTAAKLATQHIGDTQNGNQHSEELGQNDTIPESTAAKLATQHGVSEATVKRAGKLAEAVEAHPEIKDAINSGIGGKSGKIDEDQNDTQQSTAAKLATQHGVSFTRRNTLTNQNVLRINPEAMAGHVCGGMPWLEDS